MNTTPEPLFNLDVSSNREIAVELERLSSQHAVIVELKRNPRLGYFAGLAHEFNALGDWISPDWIRIEKRERLHLLFCDGAGNATLISERTRRIWEHDHELGLQHGLKESNETYENFVQKLVSSLEPTVVSPVRKKQLTGNGKKWKDFFQSVSGIALVAGGGAFALAGPVAGGVVGVAAGAGMAKLGWADLYEGLDNEVLLLQLSS